MGKSKKAFSWALNVVSIVCVGIIVWHLVHKKGAAAENLNRVHVGSKLGLSHQNWQKGSDTTVLVLSTYCRYCRASAGFYHSLVAAANAKDRPIIAVLRESSDVFKPLLPVLGISEIREVRHGDFGEMGVSATPTLLIVDETGTVRHLWTGKLTAAQERDVFRTLDLPYHPAQNSATKVAVPETTDSNAVSGKELKALLKKPGFFVLDTRTRTDFEQAHIADSLNIPYDEVETRAPHELPKNKPLVIYCIPEADAACRAQNQAEGVGSFCNLSDWILHLSGFHKIEHISDDLCTLDADGISMVGNPRK